MLGPASGPGGGFALVLGREDFTPQESLRTVVTILLSLIHDTAPALLKTLFAATWADPCWRQMAKAALSDGPVHGACSPVTEKLLNSFAHQPFLTNSITRAVSNSQHLPEQCCTSQPSSTDVPTLDALSTPSKEVTPSTGRAACGVSSCPGPSTAPVQLLHGEKTRKVKDVLFSFSFFGRGRRGEPKGCCSYHTNNLKKLQLERRGKKETHRNSPVQNLCLQKPLSVNRVFSCKYILMST